MPPEPDELKASDLLPADNPPEDDSPKKIAERRVVGWFLADRLVRRVEWRPVGNSRHFWAKIEEDDPFIHRPPTRRVRQDHTLYPADRIDRIPSTAVPQPPRGPQPQGAPQPRREAPKPPSVNRDPRVARAPITPQTPEPEEAPPPIDRRPPPPSPPKKSKTGRIRISSANAPPRPQTGIVRGPTAAEIRAEKEAARDAAKEKPPPRARKLDEVLGILGRLKQAEELNEKGLLDKEAFNNELLAEFGEKKAVPKPKRVAKPAPAPKAKAPAPRPTPAPSAAPEPRPAPEPAPTAAPAVKPKAPKATAPPVDRSPPKPKAPSKPKAEGPPRPPSGGMDDLFGVPAEGRVRIGKRTKPSAKPADDAEDS